LGKFNFNVLVYLNQKFKSDKKTRGILKDFGSRSVKKNEMKIVKKFPVFEQVMDKAMGRVWKF
jgi:hypothetical protein